MERCFTNAVSLTPGFSPVFGQRQRTSRFNGFSIIREAAEAADVAARVEVTGLKPGDNERETRCCLSYESNLE
jgi:hypothetical protein